MTSSMMRRLLGVLCGVLFLGLASEASAARIAHFEVPPGGGAYEVSSNHQDLLVLWFNEKVERAYGLHSVHGMQIYHHAQEVTVQFPSAVKRGSVVVQTASARVVVGIKAAARKDSVYLAEFRIRTPGEELAKRSQSGIRAVKAVVAQVAHEKATGSITRAILY
ncbi:MAG: hypothetical protein AAGC55_24535, partial [Myxococcota bacterium]